MTKICIFGAGSVGGYIVTRLCEKIEKSTGEGEHVKLSIVCRQPTVDAIKARGHFLMIDAKTGEEFKSEAFTLFATHETEQAGHQDFLISCLKGHQVAGALDSLRPLIGPNTCVILLQNGLPFWHNQGLSHPALKGKHIESVDPGGKLLAAIPAANLAGCVTRIATHKVSPGVIQLNVPSSICRFWFGECLHGPSPRLDRLASILNNAGVASEVDENVHDRIWAKLCISASANTTNALTAGYTDDLLKSESMFKLIADITVEVIAVGTEIGVHFEETVDEMMAVSRSRFPKAKFSMLQDVEAGVEMEIAPYVTALQEVAKSIGVPMPVFDTVATLLKHLAANKKQQKEDAAQ